jgi:hypothetical protein
MKRNKGKISYETETWTMTEKKEETKTGTSEMKFLKSVAGCAIWDK